jgi:hypothetical protein
MYLDGQPEQTSLLYVRMISLERQAYVLSVYRLLLASVVVELEGQKRQAGSQQRQLGCG